MIKEEYTHVDNKLIVRKAENNRTFIDRFENLKKRIDNIRFLNEDWWEKKLAFARPFQSFASVREANAYSTHLQNAHADPLTKICKRVQFFQHSFKYLD